MKLIQKNSTNKVPNYAIFFILIVISLISSTVIFANDNSKDDSAPSSTNSTSEEESKNEQNNSAPTDSKTPVSAPIDGTTNKPSGVKQDVAVVITDASQYDKSVEIRAFVPTIKDDGICTIKFENNGTSFEKQNTAYADASSTICTNQEIPTSDFKSSGVWNVTVSFSSKNYSGKSETQKLEIRL